MADMNELLRRCRRLLDSTGFVTLATVSESGEAWASTVNYVPRREPLTLIWYSMAAALHSSNIGARPRIAGSIFRVDLGNEAPPVGLDGAQLEGTCLEVGDTDLEEIHAYYYQNNFTDPEVRKEWMLPLEQFRQGAPRRFYQLTVTRLWLLDLDQWARDKTDRRVEIPISLLAT